MQFCKSLTESEDFQYNLFKVWLHQTLTDWYSQVIASNLFKGNTEHALILFLYFLINYITTIGSEANLPEFINLVNTKCDLFYSEFLMKEWYCFLLPCVDIKVHGN